jgi:hypothetical protein
MFARVASFEGGDLEQIRRRAEEAQTSGTMNMPEGITRTLVLADREANRRQFITFFETREALDAAQQQFEAMGDEIPEEIRGRRVSVDVYEVVFEE